MTSRKFKVWLDSGANIHSNRSQIIDLKAIGYTNEEWDALEESEQEKLMKDIAFDHADWGYQEIEGYNYDL